MNNNIVITLVITSIKIRVFSYYYKYNKQKEIIFGLYLYPNFHLLLNLIHALDKGLLSKDE